MRAAGQPSSWARLGTTSRLSLSALLAGVASRLPVSGETRDERRRRGDGAPPNLVRSAGDMGRSTVCLDLRPPAATGRRRSAASRRSDERPIRAGRGYAGPAARGWRFDHAATATATRSAAARQSATGCRADAGAVPGTTTLPRPARRTTICCWRITTGALEDRRALRSRGSAARPTSRSSTASRSSARSSRQPFLYHRRPTRARSHCRAQRWRRERAAP